MSWNPAHQSRRCDGFSLLTPRIHTGPDKTPGSSHSISFSSRFPSTSLFPNSGTNRALQFPWFHQHQPPHPLESCLLVVLSVCGRRTANADTSTVLTGAFLPGVNTLLPSKLDQLVPRPPRSGLFENISLSTPSRIPHARRRRNYQASPLGCDFWQSSVPVEFIPTS